MPNLWEIGRGPMLRREHSQHGTPSSLQIVSLKQHCRVGGQQRYRSSLRKAVFLVQEFGVIKIRMLDMGSSAFSNRLEFSQTGLTPGGPQTLKTFPQGFDHDASHGFSPIFCAMAAAAMGFRFLVFKGFRGFCNRLSIYRSNTNLASNFRVPR